MPILVPAITKSATLAAANKNSKTITGGSGGSGGGGGGGGGGGSTPRANQLPILFRGR